MLPHSEDWCSHFLRRRKKKKQKKTHLIPSVECLVAGDSSFVLCGFVYLVAAILSPVVLSSSISALLDAFLPQFLETECGFAGLSYLEHTT